VTLLVWIAAFYLQTGEAFLAAQQSSEDYQRETDQTNLSNNQRKLSELRQAALSTVSPTTQSNSQDQQAQDPQAATRPEGLMQFIPSVLRPAVHLTLSQQAKETSIQRDIDSEQRDLARLDQSAVPFAHRIFYDIVTYLPKTNETVAMLQRDLVANARMSRAQEFADLTSTPNPNDRFQRMRQRQAMAAAAQEEMLNKSTTWVVGTSVAFEVVVLSLAAWVFCRRDY
jgi:hypothetical protein